MNEKLLHDKIETYLLNRMSDPERAAFEAEITADPALATQVARQRQEHEMMELLLEDKLSGKLKRWQREEIPLESETGKAGKNAFFKGRFFWIAVGLTGIAIAILTLLYQNRNSKEQLTPPPDHQQKSEQAVVEENKQKSGDELQPVNPTDNNANRRYLALAESFQEEIDFSGAVRSGAENIQQFNNALNDLENKHYQEGINYLRSVPASDSKYWDAQYYLGLAYFEWGKFRQAIPVLTNVTEQKTYLFSEKAAWFLVLAYLQDGQISNCKNLLDQIVADEKHPYYQKAKGLKTTLDKKD